MKLDIDCVRAILIALENKTDASSLDAFDLAKEINFSADEIAEYCVALKECDMINATVTELGSPKFRPQLTEIKNLTTQGKELVEIIKNPVNWESIKTYANKHQLQSPYDIRNIAFNFMQ